MMVTDSCYCLPTGQVQVEGSPVKVQLVDTAGQVRLVCFCQQEMMSTNATMLFSSAAYLLSI